MDTNSFELLRTTDLKLARLTDHFSSAFVALRRGRLITDLSRCSLCVGGSLGNRGTHLTAADAGSAEVWVLLLAGL